MPDPIVIITCEHGGHTIPSRYESLFAPHMDIVRTHRGWDIGAWDMSYIIAKGLNAPIFTTTVTRLLVDCNRSLVHPRLFSFVTDTLPHSTKEQIIDQFYTPYREPVETTISESIDRGYRVIHFSIHSFTPVLDGVTRTCDIGILYDPAREAEKTLGASLKKELAALLPDKRIKRNYPYKGTADGFVPSLRKRHPIDRYCGIEMEFSQKWALRVLTWKRMGEAFVEAVKTTVGIEGVIEEFT